MIHPEQNKEGQEPDEESIEKILKAFKEKEDCKSKDSKNYPSNDKVDWDQLKSSAAAEEPQKKKPTGIIKDLIELQRYYKIDDDLVKDSKGTIVLWRDIQSIIKKYTNP